MISPEKIAEMLAALHFAKGALERLYEVMNEEGAASEAEDSIYGEALGVIERAIDSGAGTADLSELLTLRAERDEALKALEAKS